MDLLKPFRRAPRPLRRKENPVWSGILSLYGGTPYIWTGKDYAALTKAGYENVSTVYGCVNMVTKAAAGVDWYVSVGDTEKEGHALEVLLERPNEYDSRATFIEKAISYELLSGNSYILKVGGSEAAPRFLYTLRPDRMKIKPGDSSMLVGGYVYDVNGRKTELREEDVLHLTLFHPTDDFYGLSPLEVAAKDIDVANLSMQWNANILHRDMRMPGAVGVKGTLTDDQRKQLQDDLAKYQGADNVGKIPLFEGGTEGLTWIPMAFTPKELDWLNSEKYNTRRICAIFRVPSQLMGDTEATTYANYKEARAALYHENVLPLLDRLRDEFNAWLCPLYGDNVTIDYDRDGIEAIQEDRSQKYTYLATADWLTINEKREATGYDDLGPAGDVVLVPLGKMPLEQAVEEPEPVPAALQGGTPEAEEEAPEEEPAPEEGEDEEAQGKAVRRIPGRKAAKAASYWAAAPERRAILWKAFDRRIAASERAMAPLVKKYLRGQADRLRSKLLKGVPAKQAFDIKAEAEAYVKRFEGFYQQAFKWSGQAGLHSTKGKLWAPNDEVKAGEGFEATDEMLGRLRSQIDRAAKYFNTTTFEVVKNSVYQGEVDQLTTEAIAQDVWRTLESRAVWESRRIASTEMTRTDNWGLIEGYKQNETIDKKGWNCQKLDTSREDHIEADGKEVGIDEDFDVGGYPMSQPGDDSAPADQVCNCRCSTYPVVSTYAEESVPEAEVEESPAWRARMEKDEAAKWAKDSVCKDELNHNTNDSGAVKSILENGFRIGNGDAYGQGVYASSKEERGYGEYNLNIRINVKNPITYSDELWRKANDWWAREMYEKEGAMLSGGRGLTAYAKSLGHDSILVNAGELGVDATWYVVFDPKNITVVGGGAR